MKDSELLKQARDRISSGNSTFICNAIRYVSNYGEQGRSLVSWVRKMLDGPNTYETWMNQNHPYVRHTKVDWKAARLAWLDWMIAYCEKEEASQVAT